MDAIEALKGRRSVRAYSLREVPRETVLDILDCARLAPSAMNLQPCEFVVVTELSTRQDLADLTDYGSFIADAPVCVVVIAKAEGHYLEDAACAATCLMVAARAYGLGSCWVQAHGKPYEGELAEIVGAPSGYRVITMVPVGFGELPPPPPKKELSEVVSWDKREA